MIVASWAAHAIPYGKVQWKGGERVGVFTGTFDPPHKSHLNLVREAMRVGKLDYVLLIANDNVLHKPNALGFGLRIEMTQAAFNDQPRIIVPDDLSLGAPFTKNLLHDLLRKNPTVQFVGMVGADVLKKRDADLTIFDEMDNLAKEWIINLRPGYEQYFRSVFNGLQVTPITVQGKDVSSTEIRERLRGEASTGALAALEEFMHPGVLKVIFREGLYGTSDQFRCLALFR